MSADPAELSAIIVTHNSAADIERCLLALSAGMPADGSWEAIVVDNASRDDTAAIVGERFPWVKLIRLARNFGLAHGNNTGLRESRGRYLLVLNPDVSVGPDAADRMMRFLDERPGIGTLGCRLLYPDGRLQYSCRSFPTPLTVAVRRSFLGRVGPTAGVLRRHLMMDVDHTEVRPVDWVLGACLMVRRAALEDVGGSTRAIGCTARISICASACGSGGGRWSTTRRCGRSMGMLVRARGGGRADRCWSICGACGSTSGGTTSGERWGGGILASTESALEVRGRGRPPIC